VDNMRRMSVSEEHSIANLQPSIAAPVNMSVWTRRVLVHDVDPYLAEYDFMISVAYLMIY